VSKDEDQEEEATTVKMLKLRKLSGLAIPAVLLAGLLTAESAGAQSAASAKPESTVRLQISPADKDSPFNMKEHHVHILSARSAAADRHSPLPLTEAVSEARKTASKHASAVPESAAALASSIPGVPAPGYYPADLSNPGNGKVVTTAKSHPVYVDCAASCWGDPLTFLDHLDDSDFIHITDQYVGSTANDRYKEGTASSITFPVFTALTDNDILQIAHSAAKAHGTGYGHIYHLFLPQGVDVCFTGTTVCYSPDNPATFVFCAYHGSVDFTDIGHVLFSVEPFQDVPGCSLTQPSPNGSLIDSTSSTLAHELIETITDPDGTAWIALNSLGVFGEEIGDLCVDPFGNEATTVLGGKAYEIQQMYSNNFHACANVP
jgi:hypothetical protein